MRTFVVGLCGFVSGIGFANLLFNEQVNKWAIITCFLGYVSFQAARELMPVKK